MSFIVDANTKPLFWKEIEIVRYFLLSALRVLMDIDWRLDFERRFFFLSFIISDVICHTVSFWCGHSPDVPHIHNNHEKYNATHINHDGFIVKVRWLAGSDALPVVLKSIPTHASREPSPRLRRSSTLQIIFSQTPFLFVLTFLKPPPVRVTPRTVADSHIFRPSPGLLAATC